MRSDPLNDLLDVDFNVHLSPEEGEPGVSAGRPTGTSQHLRRLSVSGGTSLMSGFSGEDQEPLGPGEDSQPDLEEPVDEGSNLVDSRPAVLIQEPLLLDLPRELVEARLFDSYTYTGVTVSVSPQYSPLVRSSHHKYYYISQDFRRLSSASEPLVWNRAADTCWKSPPVSS